MVVRAGVNSFFWETFMTTDVVKPVPRSRLTVKVAIRFTMALIILGAAFFIPAGGFHYWNAWLLLGTLAVIGLFIGTYLVLNDPELLEKRMRVKEKEKQQKSYIVLSILSFGGSFLISGLDFRFHWSGVPLWLVFTGLFFMASGFVLCFFVMKQNSYASSVVEIQERQKVIDTGLYSVVRHPMYLSVLIIYPALPIVLGSYYALIPMALIPFILVLRTRNEEWVLKAGLEGYEEYTKRVKYRLIPFIW